MASLIARKDDVAGYVYVKSGDSYPIPGDLWETLYDKRGPYRAAWSGQTRELRLDVNAGVDAVNWLRAEGHQVTLFTGSTPARSRTGARGPAECAECAQPYPVAKVPAPGEFCSACGTSLRLVMPHVCGPECHAAADRRHASSLPAVTP